MKEQIENPSLHMESSQPLLAARSKKGSNVFESVSRNQRDKIMGIGSQAPPPGLYTPKFDLVTKKVKVRQMYLNPRFNSTVNKAQLLGSSTNRSQCSASRARSHSKGRKISIKRAKGSRRGISFEKCLKRVDFHKLQNTGANDLRFELPATMNEANSRVPRLRTISFKKFSPRKELFPQTSRVIDQFYQPNISAVSERII